jgi:hypothetical protein
MNYSNQYSSQPKVLRAAPQPATLARVDGPIAPVTGWKDILARCLREIRLVPPAVTGKVEINLNIGGITNAQVTTTHR